MYIDELKDLVKDIEKILEKNKKWYENGDNLLRKKIKRIGKEKIVPMYSYFPVQTTNPFVEDEYPQQYQQEKEEIKEDTFPKIIDKTDNIKEKFVSDDTKPFNPQFKPTVVKQEYKPPATNETKPQFKPTVVKQEYKPPVTDETKPINPQFKPTVTNETKTFIPPQLKPTVVKQEYKPPVTNETKTFIPPQFKPTATNETKTFIPQKFKPTIVNQEFKPNKTTQFIQKKEYSPPVVENKTSDTIERQINITSSENNLDSKKEDLINEINEAKDDLKSIEKANNTVERLKNLTNLIL